jgi:hypothetical protein
MDVAVEATIPEDVEEIAVAADLAAGADGDVEPTLIMSLLTSTHV